jgi:hypothetical protein
MDTSNPKRGLIMIVKLFGSTSRIQAPNSELRAAKLVCQTPLFPTMTLAMIDFWPVVVFRMVATLCDGVDTLGMVATLVEDS